MSNISRLLSRPRPPTDLISMSGLTSPDTFVPAPELDSWVRSAYITEGGPLYTPEHAHLEHAQVGYLWTSAENAKAGRRICGQAEMPGRFRGDKWTKARILQQLRDWFGFEPDFLITIDAVYAYEVSDEMFCALIDHELCHCAQAKDEFDMPRFDKLTGNPVFTLRPHEIQEFVSVVRRFGVEAAGQEAVDFVLAAAQRPEISPVKLSQACGNCRARAA